MKAGCPTGCSRRVAFVTVPRRPYVAAIHKDEVSAWAKRTGVTIVWQT